MKERTISAVNCLFLSAAVFIGYGVALIPKYISDKEPEKQTFTARDFGSAPRVQQERTVRARRQPNPFIVAESELRNEWQSVEVTYRTIHFEYIGQYFVTAYSDEETNSRQTASGVEVHFSEDPFEPTTCAIDRRIHGFNELVAIDFGEELKVYVTEDTGGNVKNFWIDCFVETMEEVNSWDTGFKSVYSVSYEKHILPINERKVLHESFINSLHHGSFGGRLDSGRHD